MNQFQNQAIIDGARNAITATDKALAVLMAYESKPDPMLIEAAIDYLEEASRKYMRNVESFATVGFKETYGKDPLEALRIRLKEATP